jgi:hypothetical protein
MDYRLQILYKGKPTPVTVYLSNSDFDRLDNGVYVQDGAVTVRDLDFDSENSGYGLQFAVSDNVWSYAAFSYLYQQMIAGKTTYEVSGDTNNNTTLLLGAGLLLLLSSDNKKSVGAIETKDIKNGALIVGGLVAWSLIKTLLEKLGVWDSKENVQLDNASINPNSFWNPNFWKTKPPQVSYTNPISYQQAISLSERVYNSFNWFNDDEDAVISVFRSLPSQAAASFLSEVFTSQYRIDLLTFLRGGNWPQDRLSDADVNMINNYVLKLPKY